MRSGAGEGVGARPRAGGGAGRGGAPEGAGERPSPSRSLRAAVSPWRRMLLRTGGARYPLWSSRGRYPVPLPLREGGAVLVRRVARTALVVVLLLVAGCSAASPAPAPADSIRFASYDFSE